MENVIYKNRVIVQEIIFDNGDDFINGLAVVEKEGKYNLINKNNKLIKSKYYISKGNLLGSCDDYQPIISDSIISYVSTNHWEDRELIKREKNSKFGWTNKEGKLVIPYIYDTARDFHDGLVFVKNDHECGYINGKNELVISGKRDINFDYDDENREILFEYLNNRNDIKFICYKYTGIMDEKCFEFDTIEDRNNFFNLNKVRVRSKY